jgi:hypothetical protein
MHVIVPIWRNSQTYGLLTRLMLVVLQLQAQQGWRLQAWWDPF